MQNSGSFHTVSKWLESVRTIGPETRAYWTRIYGAHPAIHAQKTRDLENVLQCYLKRFGDDEVCIVRAPGRVNLMGRHVDHRGGLTNFLAIDRETLVVAGRRDDQRVRAVNTRPDAFPNVDFNIPDLIGHFTGSDWLNFVNSEWVRAMLIAARGDWGNYIKAATARLQHHSTERAIGGMNLAVSGNVPIAAGLSSSSTLVVATLLAATAHDRLKLSSQQFIDLCGEGEWFVGSRGGSGDHAAIYLGQRGRIAHVGYLPFRVEKLVDAPADYQIVLANSHVKAAKSAGAKDTFNARITDYNLGLALLKQRRPELEETVEYVRDLNPETLDCDASEIYRYLLDLPNRITRADYKTLLSAEHQDLIECSFATHAESEYYNPRGVLLFGVAEILRSALCIEMIERGEIDSLGAMMRVSHDGDRVSRRGEDGGYQLFDADCDDAYLQQRISDLESGDPRRAQRAKLHEQHGAYACSTPEIDEMVDLVSALPGVAGAQIAGAGLGGCVMVLAKKEAVDAVCETLTRRYYEPRELEPAILPCITSEGAGLVEF